MIEDLTKALVPTGFVLRGGLHKADHTLILIGNLGGDFWPYFERSGFDALDSWTKAVLDPIAAALGAKPLYPFTTPPHPFLTWAKEAEGLKSSPLGLLVHPTYGLWHGYRAAFRFDGQLPLPDQMNDACPCDTCTDKPCLTTCPVEAFQVGHYEVERCRSHVSEGDNACAKTGCMARQACPVGLNHQYTIAQQMFHMAAFKR